MGNGNDSSVSDFKSVEKEAESFLQRLNKNVIEPDSSASFDHNEYRNRYESLLGALKLSHSREHVILKQCQVLQCENVSVSAELTSTLRTNEEKESHLTSLQSDLETVKSVLKSANDREAKAKATISKLQEELEVLTQRMDESALANTRKENEAKSVAKDLEHWKDQAEVASEKNGAMKIEHQRMKSEMDQLHILYNESQEINSSLKERVLERESEVRRESELREHLKKELEETRTKLETKTKVFIDVQHSEAVAQSKVNSLEYQLADAKKATASKEQEVKTHLIKNENLVALLDDQKKRMNLITEELREVEIDEKKSSVERNRLASEKTQLERNLDSERRAVLRLQQLVEDANAATRLSQDEVQSLKKETDSMRKRENLFNKEIAMLKRENNLQMSRIQLTEDRVKKTGHDLRHNEKVIASLEKELADAKDVITKQVSFTNRLEGECDGLRHQLTESRSSYERIFDELKIRDNQANELARTIVELEGRIKEEKQSHDVLRIEKKNTLKQLKDEQREVERLENVRQSLQSEIDALRSEVAKKDSALVKENFDYRKEKAQNELYADEISKMKRIISEGENTIHTLQSEGRQLETAIRKLDDSALLQRREHEQIINERDILGTQLIRRNDELALLYEKIQILQSTLRRGERQYTARLDDIRLMKIKIRDLQRQLTIARGGQSNIEGLNKNLINLEKELVRERVKVKALSDELENPINVHRWRKLEGTDPMSHELIQKIHILQKRLVLKTEEVIAKNGIIRKQQQQQLEMETLLARRPGPEILEELNAYQNDVRKKTKQMKAMASELNMHHAQVNEYKREIERLATELHSFKRKYFEQKRREAEAKDNDLDLSSDDNLTRSMKAQHNTTKTRFVGGGFAIK